MVEGGGRFARIVCGALAVVRGPGGTVAFVRQRGGPYGGYWLLPGGGIEHGESATAAVVREVREETGMEVTAPRYFATYELRGTWAEGPYHLIMLAFAMDAIRTIPAGFVGDNVDGVRLARVGELPLHATDLRILTDAGAAEFDEATIAAALARERIEMVAYSAR